MSAARISPYAPIDQEGHGDLRCPCRSFPAAVVLRRFRLPCTVRNPSASGARIEVSTPLCFPDRFVLAEGWLKALSHRLARRAAHRRDLRDSMIRFFSAAVRR